MKQPTCQRQPRSGIEGTTSNWLGDVRRVPLCEVVVALGLELGLDLRSFGPCPSCGMPTGANLGRTGRRAHCRIECDGMHWACCSNGTDGCGAKGDGVALVVAQIVGHPWQKGDRQTAERLHDWYAARGWCQRPPVSRRPDVALAQGGQSRATVRPPIDEVAAVWRCCVPVTTDPEVSAWLFNRADGTIDPEAVAQLDLARALPSDLQDLPHWARFKGRSWTQSGHRILVRTFEPDRCNPGRLKWVGLHARHVSPACDPSDKAAWPAEALATGLVLATGNSPTAHGLPCLELMEGVPDFFRQVVKRAGQYAQGLRPAIWGCWNGSADPQFAAGVPTNWQVAIRFHDDDAGRKYAEQWRKVFVARGIAPRLALQRNYSGAPSAAFAAIAVESAVGTPIVATEADLIANAVAELAAAEDPTALAVSWFWTHWNWSATEGALAKVAGARDARLAAMDSRELGEYRAHMRAMEGTWIRKS